MATRTIKVYKNEDVNNPEYATFNEVLQAFFGRGVFIKEASGPYIQVTEINPRIGTFSSDGVIFELAVPTPQQK